MTLSKGEQKQFDSMDDRLKAIERNVSRIQNIVIGIAIGIGIGAVIFGFISLKEFFSLAK